MHASSAIDLATTVMIIERHRDPDVRQNTAASFTNSALPASVDGDPLAEAANLAH
jgi:hypothetical protein